MDQPQKSTVNVYVNPANAVTASRFFTLPPFLYCVEHGLQQWATVAVLLCAVLDLFDGALARKFNCSSGFGELFDAVADGVCYGFFLLVLTLYGWVPWPPVVVILGSGVVNSIFRGLYTRRVGRATNYRSYAMERLVGFTAYLVGAGINDYEVEFYFYSCAALMVIVLLHDSKRMLIDPVRS